MLYFLLPFSLLFPTHGASCTWWYESTTHGFSYRNVTSFGAVGDGRKDDTAAIQAAIDFNRGGEPGSNADKSAAMVYIPSGTYLISDTLVLWKWTKLLGNPNCLPVFTVKSGTPAFSGAKGWLPVLVTTDGANVSTSSHAWWDEEGLNAVNEIFFTQVHNLIIRIAPGNPGAIPIMWNVAQQTSLRNIYIETALDTPLGLDVGSGPEYEHFNSGVPYNLGGGGVIEDVHVTGAGALGVRIGAAQFEIRNLNVSMPAEGSVGIRVAQLAWSIVILNTTVAASMPLELVGGGDTLPGNVMVLDTLLISTAAGGGDGTSTPPLITTGGSGLLLQNLVGVYSGAALPSPCWVVDKSLPCSSSTTTTNNSVVSSHRISYNNKSGPLITVPLWAQGPAYLSGVPQKTHAGPLPLPSLAEARAKGYPLQCTCSTPSSLAEMMGSPCLCGGSVEFPGTGIPWVPPPDTSDTPLSAVINVAERGCTGDGVADVTACLKQALAAASAALAASNPAAPAPVVFLPFGIYLVSDTLSIPPGILLLGEGLSVIRLAPGSPGFGVGAGKPVILVPPGTSHVRISDVSLWNMDCGNGGAIMLAWGASGDDGASIVNSLHDVNMLIGSSVEAKAVILPGSTGYFSNTWWPATTAYDPSALFKRAAAAAAAAPTAGGGGGGGLGASAGPSACPFTPQGVILGSSGPFFWVGANLEHSTEVELDLVTGSGGLVLVGFQTEESWVALVLNSTRNTVVYGALAAFWNASVTSPTQALAVRGLGPGGALSSPGKRIDGGGGLDLSYRLFGLSVPISTSEMNFFVDEGVSPGGVGSYTIPTSALFAQSAAILNEQA